MKPSVYISLLAIILISCRDNKTFVEEGLNISGASVRHIQSADSVMLNYLNSKYKLIPDTLYLKQSDFIPGIEEDDKKCGYILVFEEGHSYQHAQDCVEWGEIVEVYLSGYTIDELRQMVNKLYPSENYNWYENETQYRPEQYYENEWTFEIIQDKGKYTLRIAYSWI